jgi:hypothetical protein
MRTPLTGVYTVNSPKEHFPRMWLESRVPILFDYVGQPEDAAVDPNQAIIWCLYPERAEGTALVAAYKRSDFVALATKEN